MGGHVSKVPVPEVVGAAAAGERGGFQRSHIAGIARNIIAPIAK
jgi:hypothetical protein